jgi:putative flippase GtrA
MTAGSVAALAERPGVRQLVKFCIVGASSFIIDIGLLNFFHFAVGLPLLVAKACSFLIAIGNGFYWNRKWTFKATAGDARQQYPKFVLTNTIGLILNLSIMTGAILLATRMGFIHQDRTVGEIIELLLSGKSRNAFNPLTVNAATLVATVFVTVWNFAAAKFFTFKQPATDR